MITIRRKEEGKQAGDVLEKLSDDELENVDGGSGRVVSLGDGYYIRSWR